MAFCPRCGAASTPGVSFCTACGEDLPAVPVAPGTPGEAAWLPGAPLPAAGATRGPVGKRVKPIVVLLLAIVTLTLYTYYFWWRVTRETDAYTGSRSHRAARVGVLVLASGLLLTIGIAMSVFGAYDWGAIAAGTIPGPTSDEIRTEAMAHPAYPVGVALNVLGSGILLVGLWRMWSALRDDEARRGRRPPFDPRLAAGILGAGVGVALADFALPTSAGVEQVLGLLSLVITVATFVVYYQTQARLNEMWDAAGVGSVAAPFSAP